MHKFNWGEAMQPPPDLSDPFCAAPDPGQPPLFDEVAEGEGPALEPLPGYMAELFRAAGVPTDLAYGQTLVWVNAARTSCRFECARVHVSPDGEWVEFALRWTNGRSQLLRVNRYLDPVALADSAGLDGREPVTTAAGRLLVDMRASVDELLITH